jgi:glycosyltransferase involved in cell wall biosynthesis
MTNKMAIEENLRVLVDAHMLGTQETGNETYIVNLLGKLGGLPVDVAATIWDSQPVPPSLQDVNIDMISLNIKNDWHRLSFGLQNVCKDWQADVLHVTYVGPFWLPCPMVVTVHDISYKRYPEYFSKRDLILFNTLLPYTLKRARAVITISKHAKMEILNFFPGLNDRVFVTSLASNPIYKIMQEKQARQIISERYNINSDFLLAVGNLQPRKNMTRLLEAFAEVRKKDYEVKLVIVGKTHWKASAIYQRVIDLGLENDVIFTGYVPENDLVAFYNAAKVFVFPSIYEGFGLPILEAMACGTPVITANTSSMPEVAGNCALLVDPFDHDHIAKAMIDIMENPTLAQNLSELGLKHVKNFSWEKTARETLEIYQFVSNPDNMK